MQLSKKQNEYIINATHRWNIKSGAVRSGKSYVDTAYIVPKRIRERAGKPGLNVIMGVSKESIERNVLQPMREIYTSDLIGNINNRNVARVCGEDVYCLGAEKVSQVAKIQGASIKYCYGDEIAKWNKEVFQMLKSRLDKPYSCFDGACNPENPTHWLKEFLDNKKLDIYLQRYTIFDNPFLAPDFVEKLCIEYDGTVYYDRLILGLWKRAEGAIYRKFADHPEDFVKEPATVDLTEIVIGVDFGGNKSGHSFVARGYDRDNNVYGLKSIRYMNTDTKRFKEGIDSNILNDLLIQFVNEVQEKYGKVDFIYWDNAETTLGQSIRNAMIKAHPNVIVRPAKKIRIKDRIECVLKLMGAGRFFITEDCETLSTALQEAVWDEKALKDDRLDDGSSDIDTLDAFEYTIERDIKMLTE
jgi:PBSX family phage terminase large subunit